MAINFWDLEFRVDEPPNFTREFTSQAATALQDGRIVVVWQGPFESGDGDPTEFGIGLRARILNQDGSHAGPTFVVNSTTLNAQDMASITTLTDGRFVVTWHSNENGDGGSGGNLTIRARVFNADGTPSMYNGSTNDFVVNDQALFQDVGPAVVALAGGGFAIAWQAPSAPFGSHNVAMRVFTNNGPAGGQQNANLDNHNDQPPAMTALNDGRFVVAWHAAFPNGAPDEVSGGVRARIFLANGTPDPSVNGGAPIVLDSTNIGQQHTVKLATLTDGRFVATWINEDTADDGSLSAIRARVFNANGTPDMTVNGGDDFRVNTTSLNDQRRPDIVSLEDGGFLISYWSRADALGAQNSTIFGQAYNSDGTPRGGEFVLSAGPQATPGGTSGQPNTMIRTPDGRVLFLTDNHPSNEDQVNGRFLDFSDMTETLNGDGGDNVLIATSGADTLNGNGGADSLFAGAGFDILNGGAGTDTLKAGSGNDTLNGGANNDTMTGGEGLDAFIFSLGSGNDILWRNSSGAVETWLLNETGGHATQSLASPEISWKIQGAGDVNGDGRSDVIWRNDNGTVVTWLLDETTGMTSQTLGPLAGGWQFEASADFNMDGRDDIRGNDVNFTGGSTAAGVNVREASPGTNELARGISGSNDAATVLAANNPLSTTAVLPSSGDIPVVENNTILLPALPTAPTLPLLAAAGGIGAADDPETPPATPGATPPISEPVDPDPDNPLPVVVDDGILTNAELNFIVSAALARWIETGLTVDQIDALNGLTFEVADLSGWQLGSYAPGRIQLDNDAAGYGWFIDATPLDDSEFTQAFGATRFWTTPSGAPAGDFDLLTTVMHEIGHALGLADTYSLADRDELMYGFLYAGERRLPATGDADGAVAGSITSEEFLGGPVMIGALPAGRSVTVQWQATINPQSNQVIDDPVNQGTVTGMLGVNPFTIFTNATTTVLDFLVLGNRIFNDTNGNGRFDAGEGISGVTLTLWADNNVLGGDGDFDPGVGPGFDTIVATATTGADGLYQFTGATGLAPGEYILQIDESNFGPGGVLQGLIGSPTGATDPDDNVDTDENGFRVPGQGHVTLPITLAYNTEPTSNDENNTLDIGVLAVTPVVTASAGTTAFVEGQNVASTPVVVDGGPTGITLTDPDSTTLLSATVEIVTGFQAGEDVLAFVNNDAVLFGDITAGAMVGDTLTLTSAGASTLAQWQNALRAVTYLNTSENPNTTTRTIAFVATDTDGPSAATTKDVSVAAANDTPVNTVPGAQVTDEDTDLVFSTGNGNLISVADVDAGVTPIRVTLSTLDGALTLGSTAGLLFAAGDGTADGIMTFDGTLAAVNTALNGMIFTPTADFSGPASVVIIADDVGATGGVAEIDTDTVNITVNAVNDAPGITLHRTLDIVTGNVANHSVLIGNGVGGFTPTVGTNAIDDVVVGDLNGDGHLDFVGGGGVTNDIIAFFGDGDGGFSASPVAAHDAEALEVTDIDGDLDLDILATRLGFGDVTTFLNNGAGIFTASAGFPVGAGARDSTTADFDGDSDTDLLIVGGGGATLLLNNGSGVFTAAPAPPVAGLTVVSGDIDGDNDLDAVTAFGSSVSALMNNGLGVFTVQTFPVVGDLSDIAIGDLDGDGDLDLAATDVNGDDVDLLLNNGAGIFTAGASFVVGIDPAALTIGDIDGDSDLDIAVANQSSSNVSVLTNDGAATFSVQNHGIGPGATGPSDLALGDFNPPDVVVFAENTVNASIQVLLPAGATASDVEGIGAGGSLTISGMLFEDRISIVNQGNGAGQIGYNINTGAVFFGGVQFGTFTASGFSQAQITFNANVTAAAVSALIGNLTYFNISDTPTLNRTLDLVLNDGATNSAPVSLDVTVNAENDAPVLGAVPAAATWNVGQPAKIIAPAATVTDPDSPMLASATVTITDFVAGDQLSVGVSPGLMTTFFGNVLTISGAAPLSAYEATLRSVRYHSSASNPTNSGTDTTRTLQWQLDDGPGPNDLSAIATTTVTLAQLSASKDINDIVWRHTDGTVSTWLLKASGGFATSTLAGPEAAWHIQNDPTEIV